MRTLPTLCAARGGSFDRDCCGIPRHPVSTATTFQWVGNRQESHSATGESTLAEGKTCLDTGVHCRCGRVGPIPTGLPRRSKLPFSTIP